ncbi:hypothetical protein [Streptomyces sp. NPDC002845]
MRVLAEGPSRLWIAVSGVLEATTRPHLRRELHARADRGCTEFFLDLQELHGTDGIPADELRAVFPGGPAVRFHLIGGPGSLCEGLTGDSAFTLHSRAQSAWNAWLRDD